MRSLLAMIAILLLFTSCASTGRSISSAKGDTVPHEFKHDKTDREN